MYQLYVYISANVIAIIIICHAIQIDTPFDCFIGGKCGTNHWVFGQICTCIQWSLNIHWVFKSSFSNKNTRKSIILGQKNPLNIQWNCDNVRINNNNNRRDYLMKFITCSTIICLTNLSLRKEGPRLIGRESWVVRTQTEFGLIVTVNENATRWWALPSLTELNLLFDIASCYRYSVHFLVHVVFE